METPVPEARGFAAALDTYLSRGGGRRTNPKSRKGGFRYTEGPLKGKTLDQGVSEARRLWAGASPAVREKYAAMGDARMLAPSERPRVAANLARPGQVNPSATAGAGRGRAVSAAPVQGRGKVAANLPSPAAGLTTSVAPAPKAWVGRPEDRTPEHRAALSQGAMEQPNGGAPSRSALLAAGNPGAAPTAGGNEFLGDKPPGDGWTLVGNRGGQKLWQRGAEMDALNASAAAQTQANFAARLPKPPAYTGPETRYHPELGEVPRAVPVPETIGFDTYDQAREENRGLGIEHDQRVRNSKVMMEFERQANARRAKTEMAARLDPSGMNRKRGVRYH